VERQNEATTGFGDNTYGFILLSKLIDRPARRGIPAGDGHARDAARCRCIDLSRRCAELYFPVVLSFS